MLSAVVETICQALQDLLSPIMTQLSDISTQVEDLRSDVENEHSILCSKLDSIDAKQDELDVKVTSINSELGQNIKADIDCLKAQVGNLTDMVRSVSETVNTVSNDANSELGNLQQLEFDHDALRFLLDTIETKQEELNMKIMSLNSELEQSLQTNITCLKEQVSELSNTVEYNHNIICFKLDILDVEQDELNMKVMSANSELEQSITSNITREIERLCDEMREEERLCDEMGEEEAEEVNGYDDGGDDDGAGNGSSGTDYTCGGEGGWRRAVFLNMTDNNTNCPSDWELIELPRRTCGQVSSRDLTCDSAFFPVSGGQYTRVCGMIRAYQNGHADAYDDREVATINGAYVSGVSLTHGNPRQHIWTFAAGSSETESTRDDSCPCDATIDIDIPPFICEDYFCESGNNMGRPTGGTFYSSLGWRGLYQ